MAGARMGPKVEGAVAEFERQRRNIADRLKSLREELKVLEGQDTTLAGVIAHLRGGQPAASEGSLGFAPPPVPGKRQPRGSLKGVFLRILDDDASGGMTIHEILATAKAEGNPLNRGSVSSLASKLAKEGTLMQEGDRYKPATVSRSVGWTPREVA